MLFPLSCSLKLLLLPTSIQKSTKNKTKYVVSGKPWNFRLNPSRPSRPSLETTKLSSYPNIMIPIDNYWSNSNFTDSKTFIWCPRLQSHYLSPSFNAAHQFFGCWRTVPCRAAKVRLWIAKQCAVFRKSDCLIFFSLFMKKTNGFVAEWGVRLFVIVLKCFMTVG